MNTIAKLFAAVTMSLLSLHCWSADTAIKTYESKSNNYHFEYPVGQLEVRQDYICEGEKCTEFYVEDWTKDIRLGTRKWNFHALTLERAAASCLADGPDCHTDCTVRDNREIQSHHGVKGVEINLQYHVRGSSCGDIALKPVLDPVFIFDISYRGTYRILIFASRGDKTGYPGVNRTLLRSVLDTLAFIEK
jgi:hypothetical protein